MDHVSRANSVLWHANAHAAANAFAWQSIAGALASAGPKLRKILFRPGFLNRVWADTPNAVVWAREIRQACPERKLVGNEFPRGEGGVWIYDNPSEYQKYNEAQRNLEVLHAKVAFLHASMMDINVGSSDPVLSPSCM